jgi:hypothetical protein
MKRPLLHLVVYLGGLAAGTVLSLVIFPQGQASSGQATIQQAPSPGSKKSDNSPANATGNQPKIDPKEAFLKLLREEPSAKRTQKIEDLAFNMDLAYMFSDDFPIESLTKDEIAAVARQMNWQMDHAPSLEKSRLAMEHSKSIFFPNLTDSIIKGFFAGMDGRSAFQAVKDLPLDQEQKQSALQTAANMLGEKQPEAFIAMLDQGEGSPTLKELGSNFISGWSDVAPEAAMNWTLSLDPQTSTQKLREDLVKSAYISWLNNQQAEAIQWLSNRPRDEYTDQLIAHLVLMRCFQQKTAQIWANKIQDETLRTEALKKIKDQ